MYIAYVHFFYASVAEMGANALFHSACRPVCKRKAKHIGIICSGVVGRAYAFCKYLRLAASGRCKHQMIAALRPYYF